MRDIVAVAVLAASLAIPGAASAQTVQQRFEQSSAALQAGRWADALAGFEALERQLINPGAARSLAVVRVRKGEALLELGRAAEAHAALTQGLAALPASDESLREDRVMSMLLLGQLAERDLDHGEAQKQYRAAEPLAKSPSEQSRALRGLVQTGMHVDAETALRDVDRALALISTQAGSDKTLLAEYRALKGRVLLNLGRHAQARDELRWAVTALGGLTTRVNAADLVARADLSLALLLLGNEEEARRYLAYTGAGRLKEPLETGAEMPPPPCGEDGLQPGDVAVVEFAIRKDGSVGFAWPVYASKQGPSAVAFARAVRGWSWQPDKVADIPPLLRAMTRVELRCSTGAARPDVRELIKSDVTAWLQSHGATPVDVSGSVAARVAPLRAELARREAQKGALPVQLLPVLIELGGNDVLPFAERAAFLQRAQKIAQAIGAAPVVDAYLKMDATWIESRSEPRYRAVAWQSLFADPVFSREPRAGAALRLLAAGQLPRDKRSEAIQLLLQVKDSAALSDKDPLRVAALLRLSSLELAGGNTAAAQTSFAATGLTGQQCALIDQGPTLKKSSFSSNDFPDEAIRWGFEGFVQVEYDVLADGRVSNARPTVAYPPYVFSKAATNGFSRLRYDPSFRPDGSIGCGGKTQRIRFRLPD